MSRASSEFPTKPSDCRLNCVIEQLRSPRADVEGVIGIERVEFVTSRVGVDEGLSHVRLWIDVFIFSSDDRQERTFKFRDLDKRRRPSEGIEERSVEFERALILPREFDRALGQRGLH